ncbi:HNH endonuclease [Methanooceanicella nereidis]|uniref:HNH endonuclease n=1 Tax=Methanooceanicella nereidis TaxID=2052831 RepID=UPI001E4B6D6B|nr:HNH endonuclease [Methanocella sp. CWC-04]
MKCEICKRELPEWSLEEHHLVPREEGGSKGDKIYVCIACHDHLHKKINNKELA